MLNLTGTLVGGGGAGRVGRDKKEKQVEGRTSEPKLEVETECTNFSVAVYCSRAWLGRTKAFVSI